MSSTLAARLSVVAGLLVAPAALGGEHPITSLPADKLVAMAPMLSHGDIALIESNPDGRMKQVAVMTLVAAPPDVVRKVVATPERWPDFVPNVSRAKVTRHDDGSLDYDFALDLTLVTLRSNNHMVVRPDGDIVIHDNNAPDGTRMRWSFLPAPGGTVMVLYGYVDILHSNHFVRRVVDTAPLMEHGLALAAQHAYVQAMRARAEKLAPAGSFVPLDAKADGPGFGFLLKRGRVAVIRTRPDGRLADISVLDTAYAPRDKIEQVIVAAGDYAKFIEGVKHSRELSRGPGPMVVYSADFDLSVLSWSARYRLTYAPSIVDVVGVSGDLRGSHTRWDLRATGPKETQIVYRANQDLRAASPLLLGTLFRAAPFFEPGLAVALGLIHVTDVRGRAEGWK